ncbi:MAG TPA: universal stress protein, partial [Chitinophagaceae bacterium]|nr:universal stress protein [Chitinophagaceae bacterium]
TAPSGRLESNTTNLDANRIAGKTNAAIITIPENRRINHLYSIVIPITDFIPLKKLMYGIYFARYYHTTIHLLGVVHEQDYMYTKKVQKYLQRSYQLIRDNCNVPIDMTIKDGLNVAEVVKEYTTKNNADLVIVNPGRQSRLRGRAFGLFAAFLQKKVNPPVLTIGQI